jgi:PAS domain S-box-containing protein
MSTQRERFLTALLESAVDYAIISTDLDGLVTSWNAGAQTLLGWTEEEMEGQPAARFFTDEDRRAAVPQSEMAMALEHGRGSDERWHLRKDGTVFWANGEMLPLRDDTGTVQGFVKILRDRTEQRLAAEANRADSEFLRGVLASSADCIKVMDLDGRISYINESGQKALQIPDFNDVRGCKWPELWKNGARFKTIEALQAAREGGIGHFQDEADDFRGVRKYWDVQVTPIPGPDGRPEKILAVSRDITASRVSERDRRRAEEQLQALADSLEQQVAERTAERDRIWHVSQDMLGVADLAGVWQSINPAWSHSLGWSPEDILGRSTDWLMHPDDIEKTQGELNRLTAGEATLAFENRFRTKQGDYRDLSWTAVPMDGLIYTVARDVTEQKRREAALAKAEEALRQSQKMEALGQLTGGIAHDFNNLLTGIIGALDIMRRRLASERPGDISRFMDGASASAQRAAALTHRLLAFARRQSLDTKPSDINRLVSGMEDMLHRTLGEQVSLKTILSPEAWPAMTDDNQLENAILNLALNARDAMLGGGMLTIETANTRLDQAYAALNDDVKPGDYVVISVSDTGSGMPADVVSKAFDPFFTTKPIGEGTGLGLSMIYGFVRQCAGHVRIYSEVGVGSSVKMFFPRALANVEETDGDTAEVPLGRGETVLVVEDDPTVRLLMIDVLEELGYQHLEAPDGNIAIPILRSRKRIDLLLTDVGLPNMNGRQLAEIARGLRPGLRVLFVTGYAEKAAVRHEFLESGMEMMTKPFALDALATKVREMIER